MVLEFFKKIGNQWKILLKNKSYVASLLFSFGFFAVALLIQFTLSTYNDSSSYYAVGDFILDRIPTYYNLEFLFVWGFYGVVIAMFVHGAMFKQEHMPMRLRAFAMLIIIRSCFIVLTHVGPPAGNFYDSAIVNALPEGESWKDEFFRNDLFFSGHVAVPFLGFLVFKDERFKWFLLLMSFVLGATVLLMHVHYSIDVFGAFFITYGINAFSDKFFALIKRQFARADIKMRE